MAAVPKLDKLLQDVPSETLDQPCKDRHLTDIALSIKEWRSIAPSLRLTEVDEKVIRTRYPEELIAQNTAMLRKWREKRRKKATYRKLAEVFWKIGKLDLIEVLCKAMKGDSSSSESEAESEHGCDSESMEQKQAVASYAEYLKSKYRTTRPPVLSLQWPPPPTRTVINLALIKKSPYEYGPNEELVRLLQRGQVSEAAERHYEIKLSNLMTADDELRKVILIEGAPGSGKSTLAWYICQQWEKGELFTEYEVVVFVQLRDLGIKSASTLAEILPVEHSDRAPAIASLLTRSGKWGSGVLVVLDGWDELQPDGPLRSFLMQLIVIPDSLNMHNSSLIVTSRPVTSGQLQPHATSRVEVLGFKPDEVQEYFKSCFKDQKILADFCEQLKERPVIEASSFLPLNAVIVVHTFRACSHSLPHTLHEMFEVLVISCIQRHVNSGRDVCANLKASHLSELPSSLQNPLSQLASLAFHGIWINKAVFSKKDFITFGLQLDISASLSLVQVEESFRLCGRSKISASLSLVQVEESFRLCGRSKSYSFFHLQMQELLAAYHISRLEDEEQVKIFREMFEQPRFAAVFQFYSAFTKLQVQETREILVDIWRKGVRNPHKTNKEDAYFIMEAFNALTARTPFGYPVDTKRKVVPNPKKYTQRKLKTQNFDCVIQCLFEAQEPSICEFLTLRWPARTVNLWNSPFNSSDPLYSMALGFFLCCHCYFCTSQLPVNVDLDEVKNIHLLVSEFFKCKSQFFSDQYKTPLGTLDIYVKILYEECDSTLYLECASELLRLAPYVTGLKCKIGYSSKQIVILLGILLEGFFSLMSLEISLVYKIKLHISDEESTELAKCIVSHKAIESISFSTDFSIDKPERGCSTVEISAFGIETLYASVIKSTTIKYCKVHGFQGYRFSGSFGDITELGNTLKSITLTGCYLSSTTSFIWKALTSNVSIVELDLSGCYLNLMGANGQALSLVLQTNNTLRALNLSGGEYRQRVSLKYICDGLRYNTSLAYLDLSRSIPNITEEDQLALFHMLETNTTLKSLILDGNFREVGDVMVPSLAQGLAQNRGLEILSLNVCNISTVVVKALFFSSDDIFGMDYGIRSLTFSLVGNLRTLDLSFNDLKESFSFLIRSLHGNTTLVDLRAVQCGLSAQALEPLTSIHSSLEAIDLSNNPIGDEGVKHIVKFVSNNTSLYQLTLNSCGIGDKGFEALGSCLTVNTTLKIMHLSETESTDIGLKALGQGIEKNLVLEVLNVWREKSYRTALSELKESITVDDEKQFVLMLCQNEHLSDLCLSYSDEVNSEVDIVNQIRLEKNQVTLKVYNRGFYPW